MRPWARFDWVRRWLGRATRGPRRITGRMVRRGVVRIILAFVRTTRFAPMVLLQALWWAWNNPGSASPDFCSVMIREVRGCRGSVLEVGCGLTTVLIAALKVPVVSLEHNPEWASAVRHAMPWARSATILDRALVAYEDFDWYELRDNDLPSNAPVVVCDGPGGFRRGGRFGLMPIARPSPGTIILLDDADRPGEQEVLDRWKRDYGVTYEITQGKHAYARVIV